MRGKTKIYDNAVERAELEKTTKLENVLIEKDHMKNTINNIIENTNRR